jgi:hypothetical protein
MACQGSVSLCRAQVVGSMLQRFFCCTLGLIGARFVEILAADRRISQDGDVGGLYFQHAAGDSHQHFFLAARYGHAQYTGLDTGQERHVSRIDTDLTFQRRATRNSASPE